MKCPICSAEMEEGGIVTEGVATMWHPLEQFRRKGLGRLMYTGGRTIGESSLLLGQTRIPGAFFCKSCNKIVGIFDITNHLE